MTPWEQGPRFAPSAQGIAMIRERLQRMGLPVTEAAARSLAGDHSRHGGIRADLTPGGAIGAPGPGGNDHRAPPCCAPARAGITGRAG